MMERIPLSTLSAIVQESIQTIFDNQGFWVIAETADVKKYVDKRMCFLKLIEKRNGQVDTEMHANIWSNAYSDITRFEKITGQAFASNIKIACLVQVKYNKRYGLRLDIQAIDPTFTKGQAELDKQATLDKLLFNFPNTIKLVDGQYCSFNQQLKLPKLVQRIALIGAPDTDGYRDFYKELLNNDQGFYFQIVDFPSRVQGDTAVHQLTSRLDELYPIASGFDVVVIIRGGGSDIDFAPFDDYEVARRVAVFPIPVFTGIGHDRNTSITDIMGWQYKTPTKVAGVIKDIAITVATELVQLQQTIESSIQYRVEQFKAQINLYNHKLNSVVPRHLQSKKMGLNYASQQVNTQAKQRVKQAQQLLQNTAARNSMAIKNILSVRKKALEQTSALVEQLSPETILNRGFALVIQNDKIITDITKLRLDLPLVTKLKNNLIISEIKTIDA